MEKAVVKSVEQNSIAFDCGIEPGDVILSIDDKPIRDILDFKYYTSSDYYVVQVEKKEGYIDEIEVYNDDYEQFGVEFENQLIDKPMLCRNKCIFCFMDQLPQNVRSTMHFKDDDVRLSFLSGNYVTLTNLSDEDVDRLCEMKISPINISVHVTDSEKRCMMLNNRFAGKLLGIMEKFKSSGMHMNAQIVLCKGINDGEYLDKTICDLKKFYPYLLSVSVVPVGISKHRQGLYHLENFEKEDCIKVINQVEKHRAQIKEQMGTGLVYLADEFYIKAELPIPDYEYYEDFLQIENGVGLMATLEKEMEIEMDYADEWKDIKPTPKSIATSNIAYDYIVKYVDMVKEKNPNLSVDIYKIDNNFFGEKITVTGLLCGSDIIEQLKGKELGEYLLLSGSMFRDDCDIFLDDTTKEQVEQALNVKIIINDNSASDFINSLMK